MVGKLKVFGSIPFGCSNNFGPCLVSGNEGASTLVLYIIQRVLAEVPVLDCRRSAGSSSHLCAS